MKLRLLCFFVIILLSTFHVKAQNPYLEHYTTSEGLPSNTVYQVYQDSQKFIWFATDAGIVKYDGSDFVNFRKKDGLNNNEVVRVKEDAMGRLWLFYLNGTLNFIDHNRITTSKKAPFLDSLKTKGFFHDFFQSRDKTIYFHYNYTRDIYCLDSLNMVIKPIPIYAPPSIDSLTVFKSITADENGAFILWTSDGIFEINKNLRSIRKKINSTLVYTVYHMKNGFSYVDPLFNKERYRTTERQIKFLIFRNTRLIDSVFLPVRSSHVASCVLEDSRGYLWVSTFDHGLFCLKDKQVIMHIPIKESLSLIEDAENNIWVSSMKEGVYKIYPNFINNLHFGKEYFENSGITALTKGPENGVWCTNGTNIFLFKNNYFYPLLYKNPGATYNRLYYLKNNKLIFGQKSYNYFACENINVDLQHKICRYNLPGTKRSLQTFKDITFSKDSSKISTFSQFYVINMNEKDLFNNFNILRIENRIYNVFYNPADELIINAQVNFTYANNRLEPSTKLNYLYGRNITNHLNINIETEIYNVEGDSLLIQHHGKFYNLTSAFHYPGELQIRKMVYEAPHLILASNQNIYYCSDFFKIVGNNKPQLNSLDINFKNISDIVFIKDTLYVSSDDGLTIISRPFNNPGLNPSPVPYFQLVTINDSAITSGFDKITFTGKKKLSINFGCINYSGQSVSFAYKMQGLDTNWNEVQTKIVVYHYLPVGKYSFLLRARKFNSDWSEPIRVIVVVEPTFWQHPVSFAIAIFLVITVFVVIIVRRKHLKLIKSERAQQLISLEQKSLQAMMNPHFIFNSLGSIQNFLLHNNTSEAASYLTKFSRIIRQNLSSVSASTIKLTNEIDRLLNYLELERMRMENKFSFSLDVQADIDKENLTIPSMIIQPVVENAIWHGIASLEKGGVINVSFSLVNDTTMLVVVQDNGIGIKRKTEYRSHSDSHLNISLELNRKRLELLSRKYNTDAGISFEEKDPGAINPGTIVKIILPVNR